MFGNSKICFTKLKTMEKLNKENVIESFESIGYSARGSEPNMFIFDNKGNNTFFRLWENKIEKGVGAADNYDSIPIQMYFDRIKIENISGESLCISSIDIEYNPGFFINFIAFKN